ncbi:MULTISPECIES: hypothetical protein [Vitreoscilla]|uniref:Uncharacterized protein n=1 Tax=Vitreoscilla stercoraria TaxID=61 RepID=A0ABY4EEB6_VITST|nr:MULTISPECIES: hypothetical protein [Vitreoscilla]AUZ04522.1 hypothetical protein ADP71_07710 [Vitreoscilla sp. C1]UOO91767.1 hypothetical protein LVJ81_09000 [Vitreoscilla stercoraria]
MKFIWLFCLSIVLTSTAAWADAPTAQMSPKIPSYSEANPSTDDSSTPAKKIYRSKKLRIHKYDGTHRSHKDKPHRLKNDVKRPEKNPQSPPEQP